MELLRCLLFLIVDLILSSQNLDTGGNLNNQFSVLVRLCLGYIHICGEVKTIAIKLCVGKCKCNLFTHGASKSCWSSFQRRPCVPGRIGIWKCWFLRKEENRKTPRKTSGVKHENQQQTQPTYDIEFGNRTRATMPGGRRTLYFV